METDAAKENFNFLFCFDPSTTAKKGSSPQPDASAEQGDDSEEQKKEGLNGEVEEDSSEKTKEGEGAACGSKLRACRRRGGSEGSGSGTDIQGIYYRNSKTADAV